MIVRVPEGWAYIVERLGQAKRVLQPGVHVVAPFIDQVGAKVDCRDHVFDVGELICNSRDGVPLGVEVLLVVAVEDPKKATYEVAQWRQALKKLAESQVKAELNRWDWRTAIDEREQLARSIRGHLTPVTQGWGVKLKNFDITSLSPPLYLLER